MFELLSYLMNLKRMERRIEKVVPDSVEREAIKYVAKLYAREKSNLILKRDSFLFEMARLLAPEILSNKEEFLKRGTPYSSRFCDTKNPLIDVYDNLNSSLDYRKETIEKFTKVKSLLGL